MRKFEITIKGNTPIILHSCQCVNPLHPISRELKKYTSKRKKTEEDLLKISDLEWESGLYWKDDIGVYIPAENIEATLKNGGKAFKKGTDVEKYVSVESLYNILDYGEKLTKEQLMNDYQYRDTRAMNVMRAKVMRTRPRFDTWKCKFTLILQDDKMDLDTLMNIMNYAGSYVGLCDSRPRYGKFAVSEIKEI